MEQLQTLTEAARSGSGNAMTERETAGDNSQDSAPQAASSSQASSPQWTSQELLRGHREAVIVHGQEVYRLRCTRNGKLILHK